MLYGCACGCGRCIHLYAATKAPVGLDLVTFLVPVESEAQNPLGWFPHPLPTEPMFLITFICCVWADIAIIMLLPKHLLAQIQAVGWIWIAEILGHCWATNDDSRMQRLRLQDHIGWFLHISTFHKVSGNLYMLCMWMGSCLATFMCCACGWADIDRSTIMPLPPQPHLSAKILAVSWNSGSLLGFKWY